MKCPRCQQPVILAQVGGGVAMPVELVPDVMQRILQPNDKGGWRSTMRVVPEAYVPHGPRCRS
jgi:hypothetical protein